MENNLFTAMRQWASRPADQRYDNLKKMHSFFLSIRDHSQTEYFTPKDVMTEAYGDEVITVLKGRQIKYSHYGFGQLCKRADAPADYLRILPAPLASEVLNYGLKHANTMIAARRKEDNDDREIHGLMYYPDGFERDNIICRSMMTQSYKRIWNSDVTDFLLELESNGWKVPPARPALGEDQPGTRRATEEDVLHDAAFSLSVRVGDLIAPAGLYGSDHDMFVFMVDPNRSIKDGVSKEPLFRGFFISNTEVGGQSLKLTTFLYRHVCGNHIVWGAQKVTHLAIKHTGAADMAYREEVLDAVAQYDDASASTEEELIRKATRLNLGDSREETVKALATNGKLKLYIGAQQLGDAWDECEMNGEDGSPNTLYGMINGITRLSQQTPYMDERSRLDSSAGKLMQLVS